MSALIHEHSSPPTVLAVNNVAQLMISASEVPPTVYLQNLQHATPAHKLLPNVSSAAVSVAAFHPDRNSVFLLGFKDGTLAFYDAVRLARRNGTRMDVNASIDIGGRAGQLAVFTRLHRATNKFTEDLEWTFDAGNISTSHLSAGTRGIGITAAEFVPGYSSRAISGGGDGRCRIVDFAQNAVVIQTWHVHDHITCIAIAGMQSAGITTMNDSLGGKTMPSAVDGPNHIVAVGTSGGKVALHDQYGTKLHDLFKSSLPIISLEWIKGAIPLAGEAEVDTTVGVSKIHAYPPPTSYGTRENHVEHSPDDNPRTRALPEPSAFTDLDSPSVGAVSQMKGFGSMATVTKGEMPLEYKQSHSDTAALNHVSHLFSDEVISRPRRLDTKRPGHWRTRLSSNVFLGSISDKLSPIANATEASQSTLSSEPVELDPNLTLSYLRGPSARHKTYIDSQTPTTTVTLRPNRMPTPESDSPTTAKDSLSIHISRAPELPPKSPDRFRTSDIMSTTKPQRTTIREKRPSPAKQKRRSQQRPSFTAYMNKTRASEIRKSGRSQHSLTFANDSKVSATTRAVKSPRRDELEWASSQSDMEGDTATQLTSVMPTVTKRSADRDTTRSKLPNVPRKGSLRRPTGIVQPDTFYFDAPTYPHTRRQGGLLESLRHDRPTTTIPPVRPVRFMPEDPARMPRPLRPILHPSSPRHEVPTEPARQSDRTVVGEVTLREGRPGHGGPTRAGQEQAFESQRLQCTAPKPASRPNKARTCKEDRLPAHTPGQYPLSTTTTSEDAVKSARYREWIPSSADIRKLCPRSSSMSPGPQPTPLTNCNELTSPAQPALPVTKDSRSKAGEQALVRGMNNCQAWEAFVKMDARSERRSRYIGTQADGLVDTTRDSNAIATTHHGRCVSVRDVLKYYEDPSDDSNSGARSIRDEETGVCCGSCEKLQDEVAGLNIEVSNLKKVIEKMVSDTVSPAHTAQDETGTRKHGEKKAMSGVFEHVCRAEAEAAVVTDLHSFSETR